MLKRIISIIFLVMTSNFSAFGAELKSNIGIAIVDNSGNVDSTSAKFDGKIVYDQKVSEQQLSGGIYYAETDEKKTAGSWYVKGKNKTYFNPIFYMHESVHLDADEFAGYDYRVGFNMGAGLKWQLGEHKVHAEIGPGFIYEEYTGGSQGYPSGKSLVDYTYKFSERVSGTSEFSHLRDLNETNSYRVNWDSSALVNISDGLSLRLGRKFRYNNRPPKRSRMHDWTSEVALVVNF